MAQELQVDAAATVDVSIDAGALPAGAVPGDLIAIRPAQARPGKDQPILYKVLEQSEDSKSWRHRAAVIIHPNCAQSFKWVSSNRTEVILELVLAPPPSALTATYVEVCFTGVYLSRPDMLRLTLSLCSSVIYRGQRITLQGARLSVGGIYNVDNRSVRSAWVDGETKIIFRSESARVYIMIEVCAEQWQFEEDGSMLSERCEVFLAEFVKNFSGGGKEGIRKGHPTNHIISVLLYGRVIYEDNGEGDEDRAPVSRNEEGMVYRDFYKVILESTRSPQMSIARAVSIEIGKWQQQVLLRTQTSPETGSIEQKRAGRIAFAHESNILEAANLVLNLFEEHWIDRDLQRTGLAIIVVTAGTTSYHVSKPLLRLTTERMLCHGIGLDLISLSKTPLHSVPLFSFFSAEPSIAEQGSLGRPVDDKTSGGNSFGTPTTRDPRLIPSQLPDDQRDPLYYDAPAITVSKSLFYAEPSFIFAAFFGFQTDKPHRIDRFMSRARCYELLSQGVGERVPIAIPLLESSLDRDRYDAAAVGAKIDSGETIWSKQSGATSGTSGSEAVAVAIPPSTIDISHSRKRSENFVRSISTSVASFVATEDERGRDRGAADHHRISSTRSRTPVGRPQRAPSVTSIRTVSSQASKLDQRNVTKSTMPSLISRLTSQAAPTPVAVAAPKSSWLGLFRGATPAAKTPAPSLGISRIAAQANQKPVLDLQALSDVSASRPASLLSIPISRRSSSTVTAQQIPTQPISIAARVVAMGETDRIPTAPLAAPDSLSLTKYGPVAEAMREERMSGKRFFDSKFNPSKSSRKSTGLVDQERRWASLYIRHSNDQRAVNWVSICTPACLPLTSDYLPTADALSTLYSDYRYSIATASTDASMMLRTPTLKLSPVLELVQELMSQRLSHGFQIVSTSKTVAEALQDVQEGEDTTIHLSLSNQIHHITYERRTQTVVVKISRRRRTWLKTECNYAALVWTEGSSQYDHVKFGFPYPNLIEPPDWEHLDQLVAGISQPDLRPSLRYWRTRLVLLPADGVPDREFLITSSKHLHPASTTEEINLEGFRILMEIIETARWSVAGSQRQPTPTEITTLNPAEWAAKIARDSALSGNGSNAATTLARPSRWLRRPAHATAKDELLSIDRERTNSPDRNRGLSPARTRTLSPQRDIIPYKKPLVEMSYSLALDLDPTNRSDRAERVLCHFDRSHNPASAYHIELTWLAGSGKVIETSLQTWSRQMSRYGLSLIEVSSRAVLDRHNPFQKATRIPLVVAPPLTHLPIAQPYEAYLLRSLDFFLDIGCDDTFPDEIEVRYSYRRSSNHSQYIHRSGSVLVAILGGEAGFAFVPNRIYLSHSTPTTRPEDVLAQLISLCSDAERLTALWDEGGKSFERGLGEHEVPQ